MCQLNSFIIGNPYAFAIPNGYLIGKKRGCVFQCMFQQGIAIGCPSAFRSNRKFPGYFGIHPGSDLKGIQGREIIDIRMLLEEFRSKTFVIAYGNPAFAQVKIQ